MVIGYHECPQFSWPSLPREGKIPARPPSFTLAMPPKIACRKKGLTILLPISSQQRDNCPRRRESNLAVVKEGDIDRLNNNQRAPFLICLVALAPTFNDKDVMYVAKSKKFVCAHILCLDFNGSILMGVRPTHDCFVEICLAYAAGVLCAIQHRTFGEYRCQMLGWNLQPHKWDSSTMNDKIRAC